MTQQALVDKVVKMMLTYQVISKEDEEVYQYCYDIMFSLVSVIGTIAIIAFLTNTVTATVVYYGMFFLFRSLCGGYHAATHRRCYLLSVATYGLFLLIFYATPSWYYSPIIIGVLIVTNGFIIALAPIDTANKKFSLSDRKVFRRRSLLALSIWDAIAIMLLAVNSTNAMFYSAALGVFQLALSLLAGYVANRKEECA